MRPPSSTSAPRRPDSSTWRWRSSRRSWRACGPTCVSGLSGSPIRRDRMSATNRSRKGSATASTTMKRLAAMQLWPLLMRRASAAVRAAAATSASSRTTNGSLPPSSSTVFLSSRPACSATRLPARSLPVSVTPRTRGSAMMDPTPSGPTSTVRNTPSGRPASRKTRSISSAQRGTRAASPIARARSLIGRRRQSRKARCTSSSRRSVSFGVVSAKVSSTSPVVGLTDRMLMDASCGASDGAHESPQLLGEPHVLAVVDGTGDHRRDGLPEGILEDGPELCRGGDAIAAAAEGLRQRHEIGVAEVDEGGPPVASQLIPLDDPVGAVLEDDGHDRRPRPQRRLQLLHVHQEAAIAGRREDAPLGVEQLGADRAGECDAHAREAVRDDAGVRRRTWVQTRDPELVGADVAHQDVVVAERRAQLPYHALRL